MPFILPYRRDEIADELLDDFQPGDLCYVHYKKMVDQWKANPRWTTAHEIFKVIITDHMLSLDDIAARDLAWQCFFYFHVLPYEEQKRKENGDI